MIQFAFRASQITTGMPPDDNFVGTNSSLILNTPPAADPVSDAINYVRFACTGFAGHGTFETVMFTLVTHHTFTFQPQIIGRLTTAHTHFMPQGGSSLTARRSTSFFDGPGQVTANIFKSNAKRRSTRSCWNFLTAGRPPTSSASPIPSRFKLDTPSK